MQRMDLYKYVAENGCIVSPLKLPMEFEPMYRLVADTGMMLTDGVGIASVIDIPVVDVDKWSEIVEVIVEDTDPDKILPR